MNLIPYAIITAVDSPSGGWYQAKTIFGDIVGGVRLRGTDSKFVAGQKVAVFQSGAAFGFSELQFALLLGVLVAAKEGPLDVGEPQ